MYKVVETDKQILWNSVCTPLLTLADEYGGRAQIVEDDHCYVLMLRVSEPNTQNPEQYKPTYWWFPEAVDAMRNYMKV